jgi:DNA-binding beta-propeller fold protein YncE
MAIDTANRRLFIACGGNAQLKVVDLNTHRPIASIAIGANPDSLVYDSASHRIFSTGKAGTVAIVDQASPDSYRVADTFSTHYGAHTLAFDPTASTLYVAYAGLLVPPRLAMFHIQPRS